MPPRGIEKELYDFPPITQENVIKYKVFGVIWAIESNFAGLEKTGLLLFQTKSKKNHKFINTYKRLHLLSFQLKLQ